MKEHRTDYLVRIFTVLAAIVMFLSAGHLAAKRLISLQQTRQIQEFGQTAILRSDASIDVGVKSIETISKQGPMACSQASLQRIRLQIYRSSSIKDVRYVSRSGIIGCSAFSETLEFDKRWATRSEMIPVLGTTLRFFRVEQFFGMALGVLKDFDDGSGIVGILGIDATQLDLLPNELRSKSYVSLQLDNGLEIARTDTASPRPDERSALIVEHESHRYPVSVRISVDRSALLTWNRQLYTPIVTLSGGLGVIFGILIAWLFQRSRNPLAEIDRAIANGEFRPFYQPIFELESGRIIGAEVLARWVRLNGDIIPPSRFIELAENTGRIESITRRQVKDALAELAAVLAIDRDFKLSFNVVPKHFLSEEFLPELDDIVKRSNASSGQVTIELTEREAFEDPDRAASMVRRAQSLGFRVYLDDVGVGHSGLSQIQSLHVDGIKVDKFFVDALHEDNSTSLVIEMLVRLAREKSMGIIAEGIESNTQVTELLACGIRHGQGYVKSRPVPCVSFLELYGIDQENRIKSDDTHTIHRVA